MHRRHCSHTVHQGAGLRCARLAERARPRAAAADVPDHAVVRGLAAAPRGAAPRAGGQRRRPPPLRLPARAPGLPRGRRRLGSPYCRKERYSRGNRRGKGREGGGGRAGGVCVGAHARNGLLSAGDPPPPPPSRTNWMRLVPLPVLTGQGQRTARCPCAAARCASRLAQQAQRSRPAAARALAGGWGGVQAPVGHAVGGTVGGGAAARGPLGWEPPPPPLPLPTVPPTVPPTVALFSTVGGTVAHSATPGGGRPSSGASAL